MFFFTSNICGINYSMLFSSMRKEISSCLILVCFSGFVAHVLMPTFLSCFYTCIRIYISDTFKLTINVVSHDMRVL